MDAGCERAGFGYAAQTLEPPRNYMTPDGAKSLADELKKLVEIERPRVVQEVSDAAAQGDRSEKRGIHLRQEAFA